MSIKLIDDRGAMHFIIHKLKVTYMHQNNKTEFIKLQNILGNSIGIIIFRFKFILKVCNL